jgi:CheY-like chemotaxis protein
MQHQLMKRMLNILVVEDDPILGPVIQEALLRYGHVASLAPTAEDALKILCVTHFIELIILDLQLGDVRGEDIIRDVRECTQHIPQIVVHSALPMDTLKKAADQVGASAILQKPITSKQMIETIERIAA